MRVSCGKNESKMGQLYTQLPNANHFGVAFPWWFERTCFTTGGIFGWIFSETQSDFPMKIMGLSGVNFPLNQSIDNRILWWLSRQRMLMGSDRIMGQKSNFYWWFRGDLMGFNGYIPIHWSLGTVGVRWVDSQDSRLSSESLVSFQPMKFLELRMGTRVRCNTYESVWIIHFFW